MKTSYRNQDNQIWKRQELLTNNLQVLQEMFFEKKKSPAHNAGKKNHTHEIRFKGDITGRMF